MSVMLAAKTGVDLQELITGRTLLCGVSGSGKSWTGRRIVEQAFGKTGIVIVDVEGEYATLREKFPFLIIGRDVQLVPEAAEFLADQVLEHELSVILDGSDPNLDIAAFQEFLSRFIDRFIAVETTKRKPYLWLLEEADEIAPETGIGKSLSLNAIRKLVKKGRKRGLGAVVMTQRPAFVSKFVISQCTNKLIGKTEWPDDIAVLQKFARVPKETALNLGKLNSGQFYAAGDFIKKDCIITIGPVLTQHSGATPELVPPAPKELEAVVAQLSKDLPKIIQEQLVPAVPKVAEIEARLKEKMEAQWKARLTRVEKERDSVKNKTEAKYEVEIADLKRKLEEVARSAVLQGGAVSDLLHHPLVVAAFKKADLDERQQGFVELLETKGPKTNEQLRLFLQTGKDGVDHVRRAINAKIPGLIDLDKGQYVSRLAKLFPVTEEAKAEAKEVERLSGELATVNAHMKNVETLLDNTSNQLRALSKNYDQVVKERDILRITNQRLVEIAQGKTIPAERTNAPDVPGIPDAPNVPATPATSAETPGPTTISGTTELLVTRTLTDVKVRDDRKVLEADKSTWPGKVCLLALEDPSFLADEKSALKATDVGKQLERRFNITAPTSGNSLTALANGLAGLVDDGILARKSVEKSWVYWRRPKFNELVKLLQETAA